MDTKEVWWESDARLNISSVEDEEQSHFLLWFIIDRMKANYFYSIFTVNNTS